MSAGALILGVHLISVHVPAYDYQNNNNFGLYIRAPNGATGGGFRNTIGRTSIYGGVTAPMWENKNMAIEMTVGLISGYKRTCTTTQTVGGNGAVVMHEICVGYSSTALAPLVAPSIALPEYYGLRPRITLLPAIAERSGVIHLSIELDM